MTRRATYMYGALLPKGPAGQVGAGLGQTTSLGTVSADPADARDHRDRAERDGRRHRDRLPAHARDRGAGGDELPVPATGGRCAWPRTPTHNMHNVLTPRGALVRDAHVWARYLDEAIVLFGDDADVVFAQHHWPTVGAGADRGLPLQAAGPVRLHPRPDAAAAEQGPASRPRSREVLRAAAGPRAGVALPRLLRLAEPQRQGRLPALPGLVRRQPGPPLAPPPAGGRRALRGARGRRRATARARPPGVRGGGLPLGGRAGQPPRVRRSRQRRGAGAAGAGAGAARLRRRERDLAQLLPHGRRRAA